MSRWAGDGGWCRPVRIWVVIIWWSDFLYFRRCRKRAPTLSWYSLWKHKVKFKIVNPQIAFAKLHAPTVSCLTFTFTVNTSVVDPWSVVTDAAVFIDCHHFACSSILARIIVAQVLTCKKILQCCAITCDLILKVVHLLANWFWKLLLFTFKASTQKSFFRHAA